VRLFLSTNATCAAGQLVLLCGIIPSQSSARQKGEGCGGASYNVPAIMFQHSTPHALASPKTSTACSTIWLCSSCLLRHAVGCWRCVCQTKGWTLPSFLHDGVCLLSDSDSAPTGTEPNISGLARHHSACLAQSPSLLLGCRFPNTRSLALYTIPQRFTSRRNPL
jgi:hypothetical protein